MREHTKHFIWAGICLVSSTWGMALWCIYAWPSALFASGLHLGLSGLMLLEGLHAWKIYLQTQIQKLQERRGAEVTDIK